jgi:hypothetical protein
MKRPRDTEMSILAMLLFAAATFLGATRPSQIDELIDSLPMNAGPAEADSIARALDGLLAPALVNAAADVAKFREAIGHAMKDVHRIRSARDIHVVQIPGQSSMVIAYDIPITRSGSARLVHMRIWDPGLRAFIPLRDTIGKCAAIGQYAIKTLETSSHLRRSYLLTRGHAGMGTGRYAFSLWDMDSHNCVWSLELAHGEIPKAVSLSGGTLKLDVTFDKLSEEPGTIIQFERSETYGWSAGDFVLLSSRTNEARRYKIERNEGLKEPASGPFSLAG